MVCQYDITLGIELNQDVIGKLFVSKLDVDDSIHAKLAN
jgi:hypothetical protein